MEKIYRNLAIGLIMLVILAPLGLLGSGETFGEWGSIELREKIGFVPPGLDKLSGIWSSPMPDYALPDGGNEAFTLSAAAYILSAIIGVTLCGGLLYFVGKKVAKD
jgi:hypothetical protein